ncbi:MAG: hypothetical protein ACKN9T_04415 [Candidatus Methylumidiphilus sp.]
MGIVITAALALVVGFLAAYALQWAGYWQAPAQIKQHIMALPGALAAAGRAGLRRAGQKILSPFHRRQSLPAKFRAFAADDLGGNPAMQAWLLSLPEPAFQALTQGAVRYCADLKIDLSWLAERHIDVAPPVRQAARAIVADYLHGCWLAVRNKKGIVLFGVYQQLVAEPADSRHTDLRRRLFNRVTTLGLAGPVPAHELIMATERQRQALAIKAIREAAAKDWEAVAQIIAELLAADAEPPAA